MFTGVYMALNVAVKNLKQLSHQKRTLVMTFVAPIFAFYLMAIVFTNRSKVINIALYNASDEFEKFVSQGEKGVFSTTKFGSFSEMIDSLQKEKYLLGIDFTNKSDPKIYLSSIAYGVNAASSSAAANLLSSFQISQLSKISAVSEDMSKSGSSAAVGTMNVNYVFPISSFSVFETMAPGMLGMMIIFFVFIISGMAFLGEKMSGTLEKITISPLKIRELVLGYLMSFGLVALIQVSFFQIFYYYALGLNVNGSFLAVTSVCFATAFSAITLGMLVSSFAETEFQVMQAIPVFIVPQMALSGIFDISTLPVFVRYISNCFPLTHCVRGLQKIMLKNLSIVDVLPQIGFLFGFGVMCILANYFVLRKYKPRNSSSIAS